MNESPKILHGKLIVKFIGETGCDYGGLSREWFFEVSHGILNPNYCLFTTRGPLTDYIFEINPNSALLKNFQYSFIFVGRLIGIALFHNFLLDCSFSTVIYKKILNLPCVLEDLKQNDLEFYNSIKWLKKNNIDEAGLELFFSTEIERFGELKEIDLKTGGRDIRVTEANKEEYINLFVDWKINKSTQVQIDYIVLGISHVLPLTWLRVFSVRELEIILCGIQDYDINDWKAHTTYKDGFSKNSEQIKWFWSVVEEMENEERARLVQFVTGTARIPPTGFKDLIGSNGPCQFTISAENCPEKLPRAQTWFVKS